MNSCEEMTMDEIFNGKGKYYPGLIPLVYAYLDYIRCVIMPCLVLSCLAATSCHTMLCQVTACYLNLPHDCIMFWQQDILYHIPSVLLYHILHHPVLNTSTSTLECNTHDLIHTSTLVPVMVIDVTQKPSRESTSTSNSSQGTYPSLHLLTGKGKLFQQRESYILCALCFFFPLCSSSSNFYLVLCLDIFAYAR